MTTVILWVVFVWSVIMLSTGSLARSLGFRREAVAFALVFWGLLAAGSASALFS